MPPNNRDEMGKSLARILEELMKELEFPEDARIVGYTIVAHVPGGSPGVFWPVPADHPAIRWEMAEGEGRVCITASLPPGLEGEPSVAVQPHEIRITLSGETTVIPVPSRIDAGSCTWQLKNGVLDIVCRTA